MRELGIITEEQNARALADYLLTLDIATKVVTNRDGRFGVWVQNEDRLGQARQVLDDFVRDPNEARFQAATRTAKEIRKRAEEVETQFRKRTRDLRERWEGPIYRRAPWTFGLIVLSIGVFVAEKFDPQQVFYWLLFSLQGITAEGFIRDLGFANILRGEVWRLITPIFLHSGIWHIAFNMMALGAFGQRIEMAKGRAKFALIVLVSAIAGNVGQYLLAGGGFGGMSGVVFALAGYLWMKGQLAPEEGLGLDRQNAQLMFGWFLLGIIAPLVIPDGRGFPFNMANAAHGVGLASGLVFALLRL